MLSVDEEEEEEIDRLIQDAALVLVGSQIEESLAKVDGTLLLSIALDSILDDE